MEFDDYCANHGCGWEIGDRPDFQLGLRFKRRHHIENFILRRCPHCGWHELRSCDDDALLDLDWSGGIVLAYALNSNTDELLDTLVNSPCTLTFVHRDVYEMMFANDEYFQLRVAQLR